MKNIGFIFSIFMFCFLCSCNKASESTTTTEVVTKTALPAKSEQEIVHMVQAADDLDMVFNGFSMNVQNAGAKQTLVSMLSRGVDNPNCPELGLIFVKSQGEQIGHLSVHIGEGCAYFKHYENNRPTHLNAMDQKGVEMFRNLLNQIKTTPKPAH